MWNTRPSKPMMRIVTQAAYRARQGDVHAKLSGAKSDFTLRAEV